MIDYIMLGLFALFMIFLVRGFVVQMINKNKTRNKFKQDKKDENE